MTFRPVALALAVVALLGGVAASGGAAHAQPLPDAAMTLDIRGARAVYVQDERREFFAYVLGAPEFVNATFVRRWISGAAPPALLTLDTTGARAVYVQDERREFFAYVLGAPEFVNTAFADRWIADGASDAPPGVPTEIRVAKIDIPLAPDDLSVSWDAVPGATRYEIYHWGEGWSFEAAAATAGYLDQDPDFLGADSYVVRACNPIGCSDFSAVATEERGSSSLIESLQSRLASLGLDSTACGLLSAGTLVATFLPDLGLVTSIVVPLIRGLLGLPVAAPGPTRVERNAEGLLSGYAELGLDPPPRAGVDSTAIVRPCAALASGNDRHLDQSDDPSFLDVLEKRVDRTRAAGDGGSTAPERGPRGRPPTEGDARQATADGARVRAQPRSGWPAAGR